MSIRAKNKKIIVKIIVMVSEQLFHILNFVWEKKREKLKNSLFVWDKKKGKKPTNPKSRLSYYCFHDLYSAKFKTKRVKKIWKKKA